MRKTYATDYGMWFTMTDDDNPMWGDYDRAVAESHKKRFNGLVCLDEFGFPIDNEYDLIDVEETLAQNAEN